MSEPRNDAILTGLLNIIFKLRYENTHMLGILTRMGVEPNFPEYQDHQLPEERKSV